MAMTVVVRSGPGLPVRCGTRVARGRFLVGPPLPHLQEKLLILLANGVLTDIIRRTYFRREPFEALANSTE